MKIRILISIICFASASFPDLFSQTIIQPNAGLKSPQTLELKKIETTTERTTIFLTIENRIEDGYFCADKNIFIIYPDGSKAKVMAADGIPQCPDTYKFKSIGEKLSFTLTFPRLKASTEWIDIVEECSADCFYFYGVTLKQPLNERLDEAFIASAKGDPQKNMSLFRDILESVDKQNHGIKGLLYVNIIMAAMESGDKIEASVWYKRLLSSRAPRLDMYVRYLNEKGIKF